MTKQELIVERTARNFDLLNESYYTKEQCRMLLNEMKEQCNTNGVSSSDFRIEEYRDHFRIAKKEQVKQYWYFLGLYPLFVKEVKDVWYVLLKDRSRLSVRNCFEYDKYHFKTKEECLKWIEDYKKYPVYHYC